MIIDKGATSKNLKYIGSGHFHFFSEYLNVFKKIYKTAVYQVSVLGDNTNMSDH